MSSSVLAMLRKLMAREAPAQTEPVREALRRSARTGREHAVVGASDKPVGGSVVEGDKYTVTPSSADRNAALMSDSPVLDVHTHPVGALGVRPSPEDFAYYRDKYGAQVRSGPVARELRSLIVQPPERGPRASAAYNFFATDKPLAVFDPRRIDDARYELQRGAARGKFSSIMDDPAFRDYFEYGGDIGDLMEDAASLMLLRRRAEQGLGRHELQLGNRLITPDTRATERRLFEMMTPEALELLRAKKMATGGAVKQPNTNVPITGTITPMRQQPALGAIAAALRKAQQFAGQYEVDKRVPLLGGTSVDELFGLPGAAREVESWSYGDYPVRINPNAGRTASYIPEIKPGRKSDVADTLLLGADVVPLAQLANKGVARGARALEEATVGAAQRARIRSAAAKVPEDTAYEPLRQRMEERGNLAYAVKPKGGNWLAGHTDYALAPLRRSNAPILSGDIVNQAAGRDLFSEYRKVYDQDPTIGLHDWMRTTHPDIYAKIQNPEDRAVNRWIDTKLDKYIRNEMGTPEDPVRALAERGVLHVSPTELNYRLQAHGKYPTETQQFLAQSDAAKVWEGASDNAINVAKAEDYLKYMGDAEYDRTIKQNPWLMKVPPETRIYGTAEAETLVDDLGFNHLIDELKDAMNPETTLPRNLRLDPKDIDKLTMAQAVERVAKINAWRAEEAAKAERAGMMANLQAIPRMADDSLQLSFVEKPGGAWVDIPETVDDKGMKLCNSIGKAGGWCTQAEWAAKSYGSGHNRLTALVDTEGRPHAQAKITSIPSTGDIMEDIDEVMQTMTSAERKKFNRYLGSDDFDGDREQALNWLQENLPAAHQRYLATVQSNTPPDITELKPVGNSFKSERAQEYAKRDPDYFLKIETSVLKFLNSGEWGNVADLHHYGIVDLKDPNGVLRALKDASSERNIDAAVDLFNRAVERAPNAPRFMTTRQLRDFLSTPPAQGFATGGVVNFDSDEIAQMAGKFTDQFTPGYAAGGLVKYDPAEIDTIVSEMKEAFHG